MKNFKAILVLLFISTSLLLSCEKDDGDKSTFTLKIENSYSFAVVISSNAFEEITIPANEDNFTVEGNVFESVNLYTSNEITGDAINYITFSPEANKDYSYSAGSDDVINTSGNDSTGNNSWAHKFWKRTDANTYLDLTGTLPAFCSNGSLLDAEFKPVEWESDNIGYFTLIRPEGEFVFKIIKDGQDMIVAPYDPITQETNEPTLYKVSSNFPCSGGGNPDDEYSGTITFWACFDYSCPVKVTLNGITRYITNYSGCSLNGNTSPNCGDSGYANFQLSPGVLEPGIYDITFESECADFFVQDTIVIEERACRKYFISYCDYKPEDC